MMLVNYFHGDIIVLDKQEKTKELLLHSFIVLNKYLELLGLTSIRQGLLLLQLKLMELYGDGDRISKDIWDRMIKIPVHHQSK